MEIVKRMVDDTEKFLIAFESMDCKRRELLD
jgi:hypothetical protein